jgi:hypothetical protein
LLLLVAAIAAMVLAQRKAPVITQAELDASLAAGAVNGPRDGAIG